MSQSEHLDKLKQGATTWNEYRSHVHKPNFSGVDLRGLSLEGVNLDDAILRNAKLSNSMLNDASFVNADLEEADFKDAKLERANLNSAQLTRTKFHGAVLDEADFSGASVVGAEFDNAKLCRAKLRNTPTVESASFPGADLSGVDLSGLNLHGRNFGSAKLVGANLKAVRAEGANFDHADLTDADFRGAKLAQSKFNEATLTRSDFSNTELADAHFNRAKDGRGARFVEAEVTSAQFYDANFAGADWTKATGRHTTLKRATLTNVVFEHANIHEWKFNDSDLGLASFFSARLDGSDFSGATLTGARFEAATLLNCNWTRAVLVGADLRGAKFEHAQFFLTNFYNVKNSEATHGLHDLKAGQDAFCFEPIDSCCATVENVRKCTYWDFLRLFGKLPLFKTSYFILITIPILVYLQAQWNHGLGNIYGFFDTYQPEQVGLSSQVFAMVREYLLKLNENNELYLPVPTSTKLLFGSTVLLAVASTVFYFCCPDKVRDFTRNQWCFELEKSAVQYVPLTWSYPIARYVAAVCYLLGGLGASYYLVEKLWGAFKVIFEYSR